MIIVGGTQLQTQDLPLGDTIEYMIENKLPILNIKLKTVAKSESCLAVYIHNDLISDVTITPDVQGKLQVFNDDQQLLALLADGGVTLETSTTEPASEPVEEAEATFESVLIPATPPQPQPPEVANASTSDKPTNPDPFASGKSFYGVEIEEADTPIALDWADLPVASSDTNKLQNQIEVQQKIIEQKDVLLFEAKKSIDDLYKIQEIQLMEMRDGYEAKLIQANQIIESLQSQVSNVSIPEEYQQFAKLGVYAKNAKAMLKEEFSQEEIASLGKLNSRFYAFTSASGGSLLSLIRRLAELTPNKKFLLVDFSSDFYMNVLTKINSREHSLLLNDDNLEVKSLVREAGTSKIIPTTAYNDIALLDLDWIKILKKLDLYANGMTVILLFNTQSSFSVRYTVSKLATILPLYVFAECNPAVLNTLFVDMRFIPANRFKIVVMDYIQRVEELLKAGAKNYNISAFGDAIQWDKIGVKF